ncbi:hypothetical protein ACFLT7_07015 [candidate division KSB1 bacterium]
MKDVIVRANKVRGDGHYDVSYPDGRRLVFDIRDGHWDDSKPAYIEIDEFEEGERTVDRTIRPVVTARLVGANLQKTTQQGVKPCPDR